MRFETAYLLLKRADTIIIKWKIEMVQKKLESTYYNQHREVYEEMTDSLLSKERKKILEEFADHILKDGCTHCQHIVRQVLIVEDGEYYKTHCKKCGEWLEGDSICRECGQIAE